MGQHSVSTSSSRLVRIKPNALRKAELNCSLQFSFSMCIELATTCDDPRRFSDEIGGRRKFFTIAAYSRESANQYNVCRWTKTGDELRRLATGSSLSSGRRRFNAQRKTELNLTQLNWTIQFSSVQLSWVQFAAVHWALVTRKYIKHDVVFYTLICGSADGRLRRVNAQMIRACVIYLYTQHSAGDWLTTFLTWAPLSDGCSSLLVCMCISSCCSRTNCSYWSGVVENMAPAPADDTSWRRSAAGVVAVSRSWRSRASGVAKRMLCSTSQTWTSQRSLSTLRLQQHAMCLWTLTLYGYIVFLLLPNWRIKPNDD